MPPAPSASPAPSGPSAPWKSPNSLDLGAQLYDWRGHTPMVSALLTLAFAEPTARSATIGILLVVWGHIIRLYCAAYLGENTWSRSPLPQVGEVERHGPYVYVRHPLYGANLLILTGYAVYSGALWLTVLTVLAFGFQYYCVAKYEDSVLEEHFGESFVNYVRAVPAWIPARPISWEELDWPASWAKAIATEKRTFMASGLMIIALLFLG